MKRSITTKIAAFEVILYTPIPGTTPNDDCIPQLNVLLSTANLILKRKSSIDIVPNSPLYLDLTVTVSVSASFCPTTAVNGIFCFSAFLMSLGKRSPLQISARTPFSFSFLRTSSQYPS